ncbi:MAG: hypothetical protein RQ754_03125 [Desulfuromonadales bacterium]|nr:hypothetical protein [Desulfuromonadales bacterium]
MRRVFLLVVMLSLCLIAGVAFAAAVAPDEIKQPGTQPNEGRNLESPEKCDNCHGGYDAAVEPAFNWRGSAMGNAGRDPIFWATLAIAEQDFDGSGDLCVRCHSTGGWYGGRSEPTDGSGLAASDDDGVDCDTCHAMTNPDNSEFLGAQFPPFIANDGAPPPDTEGFYGSGMLSLFGGADKLGPYVDADARHQFSQSKFHRSVDFCGSCHDVSNPVTGDLAPGHGGQLTSDPVIQGGLGSPIENKAAFNYPPYMYGVVERTFSEYKASALSETLVSNFTNLPVDLQVPGGALEVAYQAALAAGTGGNYADGDPRYFSCQTCHMKPVEGFGANKRGIPYRLDLPHHDFTGGNHWIGDLIKYQNTNGQLRLGGGMSDVQLAATDAGKLRAEKALTEAGSLTVTGNDVKVTNLTAHKLISGYPEGRRMWLNIKWYDGVSPDPIRTDGGYGPIGVTVPNPAGGPDVAVKSIIDLYDANTKIYEAHYGITQEWAQTLIDVVGVSPDFVVSYDRLTGLPDYTLGEVKAQQAGSSHESFHFVLNNAVVKDNRIPPYGMRYNDARKRNALPVPADQYGNPGAGGVYNYSDVFTLSPPPGATYATIDLLYQGTSWEYIQFLDKANNKQNAFLGQEGTNLLEAWLNTGMAEPFVMASATWGVPPAPVDPLVGVAEPLVAGLYTGKGKTQTFTPSTLFTAGDGVTFRAQVKDENGPVAGAVVTLTILGPESATLTATSDATGLAELTWNTQAPNRKGAGGTAPGAYTAKTTLVQADGYAWDGIATSTAFTLQ